MDHGSKIVHFQSTTEGKKRILSIRLKLVVERIMDITGEHLILLRYTTLGLQTSMRNSVTCLPPLCKILLNFVETLTDKT